MKKIFHNLLSFFFPPLCVICGNRLIEQEKHICLDCLSHLPKTNYHNQPENRLVDFLAGRFPFQGAAAFAYFIKGGSLQNVVHELKYKNNPDIGCWMGELCGSDIKNSDFLSTIDVLVPVPLHPKRMKERGYNQSAEIAKGMTRHINVAIDETTLIRKVNNPSQTKNGRLERWKNVEDIFAVTDLDQFRNKHILLIDDVITTGSTLESCVKEILKSENARVSIYALAIAT